jgi:uncharacterized Zn finger protein (UPF0148 family)
MSEKHELLYIMNPGCGWCKKSDPVVENLVKSGYKIITLDITKADEAKRANEAKHKHNAQCGTPLFLDAETGNQVCGMRGEEIVEKWAKGEDIPAPPPRPQQPPPQQPQQPPQQPQQQVHNHQINRPSALDYKEQKMSVWNMARDILVEKYHADYEVWNNWQFAENGMAGECPISKKPTVPTVKSINDTAAKILEFTT